MNLYELNIWGAKPQPPSSQPVEPKFFMYVLAESISEAETKGLAEVKLLASTLYVKTVHLLASSEHLHFPKLVM